MTNGEAAAINLLVDYVTASVDAHSSRTAVTSDEARDALALLADKANKHFMAGADGADVRDYWIADLLLGVDVRTRKHHSERAASS